MEYKVGDKLRCIYVHDRHDMDEYYIIGNLYSIKTIKKYKIEVNTEKGENFCWAFDPTDGLNGYDYYIWDWFKSLKEERKLKLERLQNA